MLSLIKISQAWTKQGSRLTVFPPYNASLCVSFALFLWLICNVKHEIRQRIKEKEHTKACFVLLWPFLASLHGPLKKVKLNEKQGSVCKVGTQDPENLDVELKPLVTAWWFRSCFVHLSFPFILAFLFFAFEIKENWKERTEQGNGGCVINLGSYGRSEWNERSRDSPSWWL